MTDVLVKAEHCTKVYERGNVVVFEDFSMEIRREEIVTIVGPSGCGKTTLLRCLDGLIPLTSGRIVFDGEELTEPNESIAMVFQHFGLLPWQTVESNVAFGLRMQGMPKKDWLPIAHRYIDLVGLLGFEKAYPYHLSGGMQQRVGLARALAVKPKLLLLDEPFAALDAQTREVLQGELLKIWSVEKRAMVFITHSIDEAILLGSRIIILSPRPARIREIIEVPFPAERDLDQVRSTKEFNDLRNHIWNQLRNGASAAHA